jgi:hypothetical protein
LPCRAPPAIIPVHFRREDYSMFREEIETLNTLKDKLAELRRYL